MEILAKHKKLPGFKIVFYPYLQPMISWLQLGGKKLYFQCVSTLLFSFISMHRIENGLGRKKKSVTSLIYIIWWHLIVYLIRYTTLLIFFPFISLSFFLFVFPVLFVSFLCFSFLATDTLAISLQPLRQSWELPNSCKGHSELKRPLNPSWY